ncbi:MAG: hypothetical protein ACR2GY_09790 [Phycisphaerales bacterium]
MTSVEARCLIMRVPGVPYAEMLLDSRAGEDAADVAEGHQRLLEG